VDPATGRAHSIQRLEIPYSRPEVTGPARLLEGREPADAVRVAARLRVAELRAAGVTPTLALVSVGEDPASQIYLKSKTKACAEAGMEVRRIAIAAGADTASVVGRVRALGDDPSVRGLLVQLPLAAPADAGEVLDAVPPDKDVDGFHPVNAGRLALGLP